MDRKNNCLSLFRLIAALTVFAGHAAEHLQLRLPEPVRWFNSLFEGVPMFFLISGFLIWHSLSVNADLKTFATKRLLRLYPELWCAVGMSAISLLVLYAEHLQVLPFAAWLGTQSTVLQFWTPDCLRGFGCGTPNGSLWTVGVTVQCYIVIFVLFRLLRNKSKLRFLAVTAFFAVFDAAIPMVEKFLPAILGKLYMQTFLPFIWIFLAGAFLSENFDTLIASCKKYWWIFLILSAVFEFTNFDLGRYGILKTLCLAPAMFGFAYALPKLNIKYDITYGLYLYHMIAVNIFVHLGLTGQYWQMLAVLGITAVAASISYACIGRFYRNKKKKANI